MVMADAAAEEADNKPDALLTWVLVIVPVMTIAPLTVVKVVAAAALMDVALPAKRQAPKSIPLPGAVATLANPVKVMLPDVPALTLKP